MFFDLVRQRHYNAALGSYDASQCYDCMSHSFISLAAQSIGTPVSLIGTMLLAIQSMKFHIRTAYGDSTRTYDSNPSRPFQGACQGNGAAPAIWLLLSAYLVAHMRHKGHTVTMTSAISNTLLCYVGLWFVDDGDIPTFGHHKNETIKSIIHRHQQAVTCWGNSLRVTGGSLKQSKCFWYPLSWGFRNGVGYLKKAKRIKRDIFLPSAEASKPIEKLDPTTYKEVMGIMQNPLGDMEGQIAKMRKIIDKWLPLVTHGYLPAHLVYQGFWCTLWPSLRYSLPCLSLTQKEADSLMIPLYKLLLPKLNIVRTLPLSYRYGTQKYFGLCFPNLHLEQTIAKLDTFMMHLHSNSLTEQHLLQSSEQLQLEVGTGQHFLTLPYNQYGTYVTSCWFQSLWRDISHLPIRFTITSSPTPPLLRENDGYIMSQIVRLNIFTAQELCSINRVRLHHKCYAISHISTGDGKNFKKVLPSFIPICSNTLQFPQMRPTALDYKIWSRAIQLLNHPSLGNWLSIPNIKFNCHFDSLANIVYIRSNTTWERYHPMHCRTTRSYPRFRWHSSVTTLPPSLSIGTYSINTHD